MVAQRNTYKDNEMEENISADERQTRAMHFATLLGIYAGLILEECAPNVAHSQHAMALAKVLTCPLVMLAVRRLPKASTPPWLNDFCSDALQMADRITVSPTSSAIVSSYSGKFTVESIAREVSRQFISSGLAQRGTKTRLRNILLDRVGAFVVALQFSLHVPVEMLRAQIAVVQEVVGSSAPT